MRWRAPSSGEMMMSLLNDILWPSQDSVSPTSSELCMNCANWSRQHTTASPPAAPGCVPAKFVSVCRHQSIVTLSISIKQTQELSQSENEPQNLSV